MLTPAPKSCRQTENRFSQENWFERYLPTSTHCAKRLLPVGGLLMLSAVFPIGLTSQTPAPHAAEQSKTEQNAAAKGASVTSTTTTTVTEETKTTSAPALTAPAQSSIQADPLASLPTFPGHQTRITAIISGQAKTDTISLPLKGASVRETLKRMGVTVGQYDRVQPALSSAAYNGMTIRVSRVRADLKTRTQPIKAEVRYQPTASIARGSKKTIQSGRSGLMEITERVWSLNGKVTRREYVGKRIARAPQHTIVALGTRSAYVPSRIPYHKRYARSYSLSARGGSPRSRFAAGNILKPLRSMTLVATGYSPDPRENGGYTRTATGLPIGYGAAAVDPRVIPLGTKLYVEGYGYAFACDVGGAIKGKRIDLAYDSYYVANTKGRKKVKVWILGR